MMKNLDHYQSALKQGRVYQSKHNWLDALDLYKKALLINPRSFEALSGCAAVFHALDDIEKEYKTLQRIIEIYGADTPIPIWTKLLELDKKYCFWDTLDRDTNYFKSDIAIQKAELSPFLALSSPFSNAELLKITKNWCKKQEYLNPRVVTFDFKDRKKEAHKLKLGFVCGDFRNHPTGFVIGEFFELIDQDKFDVYLYDTHPDTDSAPSKRIYSTTEHIFAIDKLSDEEAVKKIYEDKIDVLVDLMGHTNFHRLGIFPYQPAPAQGTFLGFLGTLGGVPGIDYHFVDKYSLPPDQQKYFSETIKYVEPTNWLIDHKVDLPKAALRRSHMGFKSDDIVLCCFNNSYKYTPRYFDLWARILKRVDKAVLWFYAWHPILEQNILKEFKKREISEDRIIFTKMLPHSDHLARYKIADLFLDTELYNAHTTGMEALFMGCPLITCPEHNTLTGRAGGTLLTALEMPEMICKDISEYEEKVVELCNTPGALKKLREKTTQKAKTAPLFDMQKFTRSFEKAVREMYEESVEQ